MKSKVVSTTITIVIIALIGWGVYAIATAPKVAESQVVNEKGMLHWHAHVKIIIDGKEETIPANIGVDGPMGATGDPMQLHTHTPDGIIHAEFYGLVTKDQVRIKEFFKIWGKDFSKDSILGHKAENGKTITMTVNGIPNTEFENYALTGKGDYDAGNLGKIDDIVIEYK